MAGFGGLGGVPNGRELNTADSFEMAVERSLGEQIRSSEEMSKSMWCALANVAWTHKNGDTAAYSFRAAGDLIAAVRGSGSYVNWYWCCCDPYPNVTDEIKTALEAEGWSYDYELNEEPRP